MRKSRYSDEQIIGLLKQAEAGVPLKELCRQGGFSNAIFYKWRTRFAGMSASHPCACTLGALSAASI